MLESTSLSASRVVMLSRRLASFLARAGRSYVYSSPAPTVPTTVVWGSRDRILWPRQARRAAALLPDARHVMLPGCGHIPMSDDPDRVADLILTTCARAALDTAA